MIKRKLLLGPLEQEVMECVWNRDQATCREVHDCLNDGRKKPIAYTTLMTILDRLNDKEFLKREKKGKSYVYKFNKSRNETIKQLANNMICELVGRFGNDAIGVFKKEVKKYSK